MLGRCAVEVEVRGFERSGWLWTGERAGFAEAIEHGFPESLLAKSGLAEAQPVAAGDSLILLGIRDPPGIAGDQVGVQNWPELGHVQAADRVLLRPGDVGRIESALGKGPVRWPPRAGVVGGKYLDGSSSSSGTSNSAVQLAHRKLGCLRVRCLKSVLPQSGHLYLILWPGVVWMLSIHPAPKTMRLSRITARSPEEM